MQSQPDMEITAQREEGELRIEPHQADVVILGEHADAKLKIATVANDERGARLVEPRRLSTVELSPRVLVAAIRAAAGRTH